jgi:bifunctional oligoribonuclease and PAP phosphatase NrnA
VNPSTLIGTPDEMLGFLSRYHSYAVVGHEEPDGDCLCSQLALASLMTKTGKRTCLLSPGPFSRPEIEHLAPRFLSSLADCSGAVEAVVVVDCSTKDRIGKIQHEVGALPVGVIDHHTAGEPFGSVRYIDSTAPSVTFLIHLLWSRLGHDITPEEADWMLFGLCTDTGYFRHLDEGTGRVFDTVRRLVDAGASTKSIYYRMFGNRSFASRRLLGRLLERAEARFGNRVLVTWESLDDLEEFGPGNRDSDTLYRELQAVSGCEAVVLVRAETATTTSVGLRSLDSLDVGEIARKLGGGGHRNASGYLAHGDLESTFSAIMQVFEKLYAGSPPA